MWHHMMGKGQYVEREVGIVQVSTQKRVKGKRQRDYRSRVTLRQSEVKAWCTAEMGAEIGGPRKI
jgi:hypothetical protein